MSTYLYLECLDHDPPLRSDGESGQHLTDLPEIRADIAKRVAWVEWSEEDDVWNHLHHFRCNTITFLRQHPRCRLGIRDEYGHEHPTTEEQA